MKHNNEIKEMKTMETFKVQIQYGDMFEDVYVQAKNANMAINLAKKLNPFNSNFVNYVI